MARSPGEIEWSYGVGEVDVEVVAGVFEFGRVPQRQTDAGVGAAVGLAESCAFGHDGVEYCESSRCVRRVFSLRL